MSTLSHLPQQPPDSDMERSSDYVILYGHVAPFKGAKASLTAVPWPVSKMLGTIFPSTTHHVFSVACKVMLNPTDNISKVANANVLHACGLRSSSIRFTSKYQKRARMCFLFVLSQRAIATPEASSLSCMPIESFKGLVAEAKAYNEAPSPREKPILSICYCLALNSRDDKIY